MAQEVSGRDADNETRAGGEAEWWKYTATAASGAIDWKIFTAQNSVYVRETYSYS